MSKTPIWDALKANAETVHPGGVGAHDQALTNSLLVAQNELLERIADALGRLRPVFIVVDPRHLDAEGMDRLTRAFEEITGGHQ